MINNVLLYLSTGFILFSIVLYFLLIMMGRRKNITKSNTFDITKDIISEYDSINVIESKNYFTFYNIKRKVIKLASRCYYGSDISSISLSLIEAGISVLDDTKNRYINLFRKVFSNLKILYIFPILSILINYITYNISDVKVSMILIILFSFITYTMVDIKTQVFNWINDNIKRSKDINKDNSLKVMNFINRLIYIDKFIFFGQLMIIIRFILILLDI